MQRPNRKKLVLLCNKILKQQVGHHIITPFVQQAFGSPQGSLKTQVIRADDERTYYAARF
eukprot:1161135-Pelagomonas_calceolata.AAC.1